MNAAFQISEEDVLNVLASNVLAGERPADMGLYASSLFEELDLDKIEQAAMFGDDLDQQTDFAYDEITQQLRDAGVLVPSGHDDLGSEACAPTQGSAP